MSEKLYRTVKQAGAGSLVLGIIILITGLTVGILSIVNSARLLAVGKNITF